MFVKCLKCHSNLERNGDYCLSCGNSNTHLLGVYVDDEFAHLFCFYNNEYVGSETIRLIDYREGDEKEKQKAYRNSVELLSEAIHRKRPEKVIVSGMNPKEILHLWNPEIFYTDEFEEVEEFKNALKKYTEEKEIDKVNLKPEKKLGGRHSTVIGGRNGWRVLMDAGTSPFIKKIIPGPIEVSGRSGEGFNYKIQQPDRKGNLRILLKEGSAVQEVRLVSTAYDEKTGEKVREELIHRLGYSENPK